VVEPTKQKIISTARQELATNGVEGCSIRDISKKVGVAPSVLYYHFPNKEELLKEVFNLTNTALAQARAMLKVPETFYDALKQRIIFQFDHAEEIVAVLKYYLHFRPEFQLNPRGYLPNKTYLHIEEVLELAQQKGVYNFPSIEKESKVIVHAINGFVLEYFPAKLSQKEKHSLVDSINDFILRAISPYKR
jgi:AcrR family transcriptional regulator